MISSTIADLPDHRKQVENACLRQGTFPLMMEHRPPVDKDAIEFSLGLVDEADIYVGVYGSRYGYVPKDGNPKGISVTEMEYDRAVERGIPRLIFVMNENHPVSFGDMEQGEGAVKLKVFLERVKINFVNFFSSPEELRTLVVSGLADAKATLKESRLSEQTKPLASEFHYVSNIPQPPEAYIAHPYTLLQTHGLIGRQKELNWLTDWVGKPESEIYKAHI